MFEHITILLSFVFAIAITHLFTSATELIWARDRVRFSGLQALWMVNALLVLLINWLSLWQLNIVKWDVAEIIVWFAMATAQYFTCSLISMRAKEEGVVDMAAFYERHRPVIFSAFLCMVGVALFQTYWDRNHSQGLSPTAWIAQFGIGLVMALICAVAGWARPKWAQWPAGLAMLLLSLFFFGTYAILG